MVLSKGHEVVGRGFSRLSRDAARAANRGEELGNPNRVRRFPGNTTWIGRQIRLLGTTEGTRIDTRVR
jgi:hypothetical protein